MTEQEIERLREYAASRGWGPNIVPELLAQVGGLSYADAHAEIRRRARCLESLWHTGGK